jgi:hypothetical protein
VTNFSDKDNDVVSAMEADNQKPETEFFFSIPGMCLICPYFLDTAVQSVILNVKRQSHIDHHENSSTLLKSQQQYENSQTNVKLEIRDDIDEHFEVVQEFDDFDEQYGLDEEPKTTSGKESLDSWANFHDFSEKTNIKQEINNDNDESYEAKQEFDNFDEQYSLDEEPKAKSGQKVARKGSSVSRLNFHDFSEDTYNSKTESVAEDVIVNNLKDDHESD